MKTKRRLWWACALLLAGLAVVEGFRVKWNSAERLGHSPAIAGGPVREEELAYRRQVATKRLEGKQQVTRDLIAGHLTLLEAAVRFQVLNKTPVDCPFRYENSSQGRGEGEQIFRQVINWAVTEVAQRSEIEAQILSERLERELEEHLRRHGPARLPESRK
jgi:hypothetical protein